MYNPELLTAYIIAGTVSSVILFTAFKIVRTSGPRRSRTSGTPELRVQRHPARAIAVPCTCRGPAGAAFGQTGLASRVKAAPARTFSRRPPVMQALFIGQTYIDVTFLTDHIPTGDEKTVAEDYAVSFGGNAVTAAFACAKLGSFRTSWPRWRTTGSGGCSSTWRRNTASRSTIGRCRNLAVLHHASRRQARACCRDDHYLHPVPPLNIDGCRALHLDGHQPDAAMHL